MTLYHLSVTLHVLAALVWLGGMLFLAMVGAPVLRQAEPALRQRLFTDLGARFRTVGWWSIGILVVTGLANLYFRGLLRWDGVLGSGAFWASATGSALAVKLVAVAVMLAIEGVHDIVVGPAAGRVAPGSPEAMRLRRRAALLARASTIIGIVVVAAAVRLVRPG
jgi:uncharacterized membrane protein